MKPDHQHEKYKETNVPWIGKIPIHWDMVRIGAVLQERGETNEDGTVNDVLSLVRQRGVIPYEEKGNIGNKMSEDITRYKIVRPNDIVVNSMNVIIGSVGLSEYTGCLSPVYYVLRKRSPTDDSRYIAAYFQSLPFQRSLTRLGNGILAHRMRIPMDLLKSEPFPKPPPEEQTAIVRFIDHAGEQIQRYIAGKERLIALLEEERQALVHQAVTRGLDPSIRLKPSGIEWLGDIPEYWAVRRLKSLASIGTGDKDTINRNEEGKYPFFVRSQKVERIDTWSFDGEAVLTAGDGVGVGKVFHYINGRFDFHQRVYKFSDFREISGKLFYYSLTASLPYHTLQGTAKSTVDSLRLPMLQNIGTPLRSNRKSEYLPPIQEQQEITEYLERVEQEIKVASSEARRQIDLMNEYRTRLIADVVTGQLDVREASAQVQETP